MLLIYRYPTHFPTYRKTRDFGPFCITLPPPTLSVIHYCTYTLGHTLLHLHIGHIHIRYYTFGHTLLHLHIGTYIYGTTLSGTTLQHLHYCRSLGIHLSLIYRYPTHFPTYRKTRNFGPFCITIPPLHYRSYTTVPTHRVYTTAPTYRHTHIRYYTSGIYCRHPTLSVIHYCTYTIAEFRGFICHSFIDIPLISPHIGKPGISD